MEVGIYIPNYSSSLTGKFARVNDVLRFSRIHTDDRVQFTVFPGVSQNKGYSGGNVVIKHLSTDHRSNILGQSIKGFQQRNNIDVFHIVGAGFGSIPFFLLGINKPIIVGPNVGGKLFPWHMHTSIEKELFLEEKGKKVRKMNIYGENIERCKLTLMTSKLFDNQIFVAFSKYMKNKNLEERGVPSEMIKVLPSGVCRDVFRPLCLGRDSSDNFDILFVGRPGEPSKSKGSDILIKALDKLHEMDWSLTVLGNDRPHKSVRKIYKKNSHKIEFASTIPRNRLPIYYNQADVYVCPSIFEVESTTMIEALSCGTPCIATDEPSFREISMGENTIFFENRNPVSLAKALKEMHDNLDYYNQNARDQAENYDIRKTYERLIDIYSTLLG